MIKLASTWGYFKPTAKDDKCRVPQEYTHMDDKSRLRYVMGTLLLELHPTRATLPASVIKSLRLELTPCNFIRISDAYNVACHAILRRRVLVGQRR